MTGLSLAAGVALAASAIITVLWLLWRRSEKRVSRLLHELRLAQEYFDTRGRMDNVEIHADDPDRAAQRLRDREQ